MPQSDTSGKTTFCNFLEMGANQLESTPTIGLNVKMLKKGGVQLKVWDIGGQHQFRDEWPRYCKGVDCIIFLVDASDPDKIPTAKKELHRLLEHRELARMPLLVLGNKCDCAKVKEPEMIKMLNLDYITENPWVMHYVSAKRGDGIETAVEFLIQHSRAED